MSKTFVKYAQVVFPLPFRNIFTYGIPEELEEVVRFGIRVVVPFGKRIMTGYVVATAKTTNIKEKIKAVQDVLDERPLFDKISLKFYEWLSDYYLCSLGEALRNSVPYGSDIESKRKIISEREICATLYDEEKKKTTVKAKLLKLLSEKETNRISQLQKTLKKKSIYSTLKSLEKKGAVTILDFIEEAKVRVKKAKFVRLAKSIDDIYEAIPEIESRSQKQVVILLELLSRGSESVLQSELLAKTGTNQSSLKSLIQKELVEVFEKEVERVFEDSYNEDIKKFDLTGKQKSIVDKISLDISGSKFTSYLLHGVTGSGKTQVYIELAKKALDMGKTALILVPEISLTPQITSRFYNTFGDITTVIHSRISLGERYDAWRGIIKGKYKVVIGPRSALFAPLQDLGIIVVDEEHDHSYKQFEMIPKYNARDAAIVKANLSNCPVLLGSATPSLESMHNAFEQKYHLLELKERVDNAKMPVIRLVDLSIEKKKGKLENIFSQTLIDYISDRLRKKESVILLQNRRGFSTQVYCDDCGSIETCVDCDVSLVHHINKNMLQCHYCGYTKPVPKACTTCGSLSIRFFGTGTQRVEDELAYYFPEAKIERIDSDTMGKKGQLGLILNSFRKGEIDVLVGTQMVSKGLDFSNVTLVGVISAETTLWLPDFRADERTFQLLTQVAGRAGRSGTPGEVIIQTYNRKHFVLQKVLRSSYEEFYNNEIEIRKKGGYPPFTRLALIEAKDENEYDARDAMNDFYNRLLKYREQLSITTPTPAMVSKIKGQYRFHILIRTNKSEDPGGKILRTAISNILVEYNRQSRYKDIKLLVDIDPVSIS
jgi:primosomal protein N' (replication factor Y)